MQRKPMQQKIVLLQCEQIIGQIKQLESLGETRQRHKRGNLHQLVKLLLKSFVLCIFTAFLSDNRGAQGGAVIPFMQCALLKRYLLHGFLFKGDFLSPSFRLLISFPIVSQIKRIFQEMLLNQFKREWRKCFV